MIFNKSSLHLLLYICLNINLQLRESDFVQCRHSAYDAWTNLWLYLYIEWSQTFISNFVLKSFFDLHCTRYWINIIVVNWKRIPFRQIRARLSPALAQMILSGVITVTTAVHPTESASVSGCSFCLHFMLMRNKTKKTLCN